jgi:hypothetical protein
LVSVVFLDLSKPLPPDLATRRAYAYQWLLPFAPVAGHRVQVESRDGATFAVVSAPWPPPNTIIGANYRRVIRLATNAEIASAVASGQRGGGDDDAWLDMARRVAGLKTPGKARKTPPKGYPQIAPTDGYVDAATAGKFGSMWWRAYKMARTEDERKAFGSIASRWYKIRDRG